MNEITDPDDLQHLDVQPHRPTAEVDQDAVVRTAADDVPDAVEAVDVSRRAHSLDVGSMNRSGGRGVEWVRPSDLIARHTGQLAGRGIDFHNALAARSRAALTIGARGVGDRVRHLSPLSAFGRGSRTMPSAERSGVGLS